ncbi:MAG: fatty acid desaturase family protein [Acidobacteria bacterium]|jgi:omega-6 fatty acid desaturase (delta-12 desaturase)|nr:fatty acid desaturase family protein [Acidobacteriota bacterium]
MTAPAHDETAWRKLLAPYKRPSWRHASIQLLNSALPFGLLWALMATLAGRSYLLTLLLAVPASFFFVRLFIIQHDCGHGSFFPSRRANNLLGGVLGVVTLFPYGYWKKTHAIHHATSGNLDDREFGDIVTLTVREYRALSPMARFGYRLYRNPLVMLGVGPFYQFVIKHRFPFDIPFAWKREWRSVLGTNVALAAVVTALGLTVGWKTFALVQLPIIVVAGAIGVWLFYVQHQFEDTYWEHEEAWDFYRAGAHGSSFYDLGRIGHWLTGNIGYHHIHHLASQIPNYRLAACFRDNPEMQRVTRLTVRDSLRCARLVLWDEERRTMVPFRSLAIAAAGGRESVPPLAAGG